MVDKLSSIKTFDEANSLLKKYYKEEKLFTFDFEKSIESFIRKFYERM